MKDEPDCGSILLEGLKYTTSERLKSAQRKFTTARNTITGEALTRPYEAFFSEKDKEILRQAASILGQFKNKVEHAKEVRAREENARDLHLKKCRALREKYLKQHLVQPVSIKDHIECVTFHLALQQFKDSIAAYRGVHFGHGIAWVENDLNQAVDEKYPHIKVKHVAVTCNTESFDWLGENLWRYDEEPDANRLTQLLDFYRGGWRETTLDRYQVFFRQYNEALQIEFEKEAIAERAKMAAQRRAEIKSVK